MKTTFSKTALGALAAILVAGAAGPAASTPFPSAQAESALLLAEDGADMLQQYHQLRRERWQVQRSGQDGERFILILEEQPTAAGEQTESGPYESRQDNQPRTGWTPEYKSNMHKQRMEYGH